jgi:hypothetical protein
VFSFSSGTTGTAEVTTRVGSSSPSTLGSAWPFTFGSSLSASFDVPIRSAWLVTTVPSARVGSSVTSNWIEISL